MLDAQWYLNSTPLHLPIINPLLRRVSACVLGVGPWHAVTTLSVHLGAGRNTLLTAGTGGGCGVAAVPCPRLVRRHMCRHRARYAGSPHSFWLLTLIACAMPGWVRSPVGPQLSWPVVEYRLYRGTGYRYDEYLMGQGPSVPARRASWSPGARPRPAIVTGII